MWLVLVSKFTSSVKAFNMGWRLLWNWQPGPTIYSYVSSEVVLRYKPLTVSHWKNNRRTHWIISIWRFFRSPSNTTYMASYVAKSQIFWYVYFSVISSSLGSECCSSKLWSPLFFWCLEISYLTSSAPTIVSHFTRTQRQCTRYHRVRFATSDVPRDSGNWAITRRW